MSRDFGNKQKVALIDSPLEGGSGGVTVRYQYTNHLDSASLELDKNADIISYEEYHPFGTTSYRSGRNEVDVSLKRYKYVHKELDNETGLYYYGMRYYAAWIARFISVDPLQFDYPHYTPYQYAGNKPISFIDLDGAEEAEASRAQTANGVIMGLIIPTSPKIKKEPWTHPGVALMPIAKYSLGTLAAIEMTALGIGLTAKASAGAIYSRLLSLATKTALKGGVTGGVVSGSISYLSGDEPLKILENTVSGFVSGMIIGSGGSSFSSLVSNGAVGEGLGELTSQLIDVYFGESRKVKLKDVVKQAGIGAIANVLSSKLIDMINAEISKKTSEMISYMGTDEYKDIIKKAVADKHPNLVTTGKKFKSIVSSEIKSAQRLIKEQNIQFQVGAEKFIDRSIDVIQNRIERKIDER